MSLSLPRFAVSAITIGLSALLAGCGADSTPPGQPVLQVGTIQIVAPSATVERGYHLSLAAVVKNTQGTVISIPVVWRSLNENVLTIDANGRVTALDTGTTGVYASSLGVTSIPITLTVLYTGAAKIAPLNFAPPGAISPGTTPDSIRVLVTDRRGAPVTVPTRVAFAVTAGGGTISPAIATTSAAGVAAASWMLGGNEAVNTATATVLGEDDKPVAFVVPNSVSFSIRSFSPLLPVAGNNQTGQIRSALPVQPSVKLVDSTGSARIGVPVTFSVTNGGHVAFAVVSTGADGIASPGDWTLGDVAGEQLLTASVELSSTTLRATATGTALYYTPALVVAGGFATCAIETDATVSCMGEEPKVGDSSAVNKTSPTPTRGGIKFTALAGTRSQPSHFCGVSADKAIYCWGLNAFADTSEKPLTQTAIVPTRVPTNVPFSQVSTGQAHNCALDTDQNAYCWGDNTQGQLGDRSTKSRNVPGLVFGSFKYTSITTGGGHNCGLTAAGAALCWGANQSGQIGNGSTSSTASPTAVSGGLTFRSVSAGDSFTCGLTTDGRAYCWGSLGTGQTVVSTPRTYPDSPAFVSIAAGGFHVCALTAEGKAYCWGPNTVGQVGDSSLVERPNPTLVATPIRFKSVSAGYGHTCGNALDGAVACWGLNKTGELGDSTLTNHVVPRFIVLNVTPAASAAARRGVTRRTSQIRGTTRQ